MNYLNDEAGISEYVDTIKSIKPEDVGQIAGGHLVLAVITDGDRKLVLWDCGSRAYDAQGKVVKAFMERDGEDPR